MAFFNEFKNVKSNLQTKKVFERNFHFDLKNIVTMPMFAHHRNYFFQIKNFHIKITLALFSGKKGLGYSGFSLKNVGEKIFGLILIQGSVFSEMWEPVIDSYVLRNACKISLNNLKTRFLYSITHPKVSLLVSLKQLSNLASQPANYNYVVALELS